MSTPYGPISGERGIGVPLVVPDVPDFASVLTHWLVEARGWHPQRTQWLVAIDSMAPVAGLNTPIVRVPGATYQIGVFPLDPSAGHQTDHSVLRLLLAHELPIIRSHGEIVVVQTIATTAEMWETAPLLVHAIVHGNWSPDASTDGGNVRGAWREAIERNLHTMRQRPQAAPHPQAVRVPTPPTGWTRPPASQLLTGPMTPPGGSSTE